MFFGCGHKKLSDVKDGYQYCLNCNKAFPVSGPACIHKWVIINSIEGIMPGLYGGKNISRHIHVLQCAKCGELEKRDFHFK